MARKKRAAATSNGDEGAADGGKLNKTQAVLAYLKDHPRAKNKQMAEELTKQHGVEFKPTAVSTIKHQLKKRGALKGKRGPGRPAAASSNKVDVADLVAAKKFAAKFGGAEKARQILNVLAQLES
jgi:transposase